MLRPWHEAQLVSLEMAFAVTPLCLVINLAKVFLALIFLSCWCMELQRSIVWQWQRRNPHPLWVAVLFYFLWLPTLYFISWILGSHLSLCFQSCVWELHDCALHSFGNPNLWLSCLTFQWCFFYNLKCFYIYFILSSLVFWSPPRLVPHNFANIQFSSFSRSLKKHHGQN